MNDSFMTDCLMIVSLMIDSLMPDSLMIDSLMIDSLMIDWLSDDWHSHDWLSHPFLDTPDVSVPPTGPGLRFQCFFCASSFSSIVRVLEQHRLAVRNKKNTSKQNNQAIDPNQDKSNPTATTMGKMCENKQAIGPNRCIQTTSKRRSSYMSLINQVADKQEAIMANM